MQFSKTAAMCAALAVGGIASSASAANFLFSYSSNDGTQGAFGQLDATANGDGTWTATSGTIQVFGNIRTGLGTLVPDPIAPLPIASPSGAFLYDDQLLPGQNPLITVYGLLFDVGSVEANIFSNGPGPGTYEFAVWNGSSYGTDLGNFTLTYVPEPASWACMLVGLGLMGAMLRRRKEVTV
ncbi:MAG TPA: PEPxxWA-CTERM sorting domain-containing protein [Caulobacteraceae bacterium]